MAARLIGTKDSAFGLTEIIDSAKSTIVLVTPFVQLSYTHKMKLNEASEKGKQILLVCRRGALYPNQLADLERIRNLKLIDDANVHAKCYFNESKMLITSLNLYNSSIESNVELGVWFDRAESKEKFSRAVADAISEMNISALNLELAKMFTKADVPGNFERKKFETQFRLYPFKPLPNIKGYCIRCHEQMNYMNGTYPLCSNCFVDWAKEYDFNAPEKCCHWCGTKQETTKRKPLCFSCFSKYKEAAKGLGVTNEVEAKPTPQPVRIEAAAEPVAVESGQEKSSSHGINYRKIAIIVSAVLAILIGAYFVNSYWNSSAPERSRGEVLNEIIHNYYMSWQKSPDSIASYFAPNVARFITLRNTTPAAIVEQAKNDGKEFMYPQTRIIDSTFSSGSDLKGSTTISFWIKFKCFRASKKQYQTCNVHEEFVFDANNKIVAINELAVEELEFSFQEPEW